MGIDGIDKLSDQRVAADAEANERMATRDAEAQAEHEQRQQFKASDNRERQVRQGVVSETPEEAPEETPE